MDWGRANLLGKPQFHVIVDADAWSTSIPHVHKYSEIIGKMFGSVVDTEEPEANNLLHRSFLRAK
ncbi:hypothetical protein PIB30_082856, partial [Stylosanthes scabra]|nr:hypothetical protein [Stylosanthes scabra]